MTYLLFILGFIVLIKGAGWTVDGATSIARRFQVSQLVIGLTIVAFGTSLPELFVNISAAINHAPNLAIGNILGSNIANILLILGLAALIYPLRVTRGTVWKEIPFGLLAAVMVFIMANDILIDRNAANLLSRSDGLILFAFFIIFLYYIFGILKISENGGNNDHQPDQSLAKSLGIIVAGVIGLIVGGEWIINGAVAIAEIFGLSETFIGLTILAVGTSLPELATSAVAAYKRNVDIAVGNIIGSNIFNIFWILAISALIRPLPFAESLNFDILITIFASFLLFIWMFVGKRHTLDRWQGAIFVLLYAGYLTMVVVRG